MLENLSNITLYQVSAYLFTCVTAEVYFEPTGFVISLVTARIGTSEMSHFSEVGPVVGEQGTESDEGLLTSWGGTETPRSSWYYFL